MTQAEDSYAEVLAIVRREAPRWTSPQRQRLVIAITQGSYEEIIQPRPRTSEEKRKEDEIVQGVTLRMVLEWADNISQLIRAPNHIQVVSYLVWQHAGLRPHGSPKSWAAHCSDLWEAAGQDPELIVSAAMAGAKARLDDGITISSPRSLSSYARSIRAKEDSLPEQGALLI